MNKNPFHHGTQQIDEAEAVERHRATLLQNELVAGNPEIAQRILEASKTVWFKRGQKIIAQNEGGEEVYFILSGSVDVRINNRHIDVRNAPLTVGEMAAKRAGSQRTADVIVRSSKLEARVVTGTVFRKMMADYSTFAENLEDSIDVLSRNKIAQLGEKDNKTGISWATISAIVGGASVLAGAFIAWILKLELLYIALGSLPLGIIVFVFMLLLNPELRYRNMFSAAGGALILLLVYGSISWALTIDGVELDLPFLIKFSIQTEQQWGEFAICVVGLLLFACIAGYLDYRHSHAKENG